MSKTKELEYHFVQVEGYIDAIEDEVYNQTLDSYDMQEYFENVKLHMRNIHEILEDIEDRE